MLLTLKVFYFTSSTLFFYGPFFFVFIDNQVSVVQIKASTKVIQNIT